MASSKATDLRLNVTDPDQIQGTEPVEPGGYYPAQKVPNTPHVDEHNQREQAAIAASSTVSG